MIPENYLELNEQGINSREVSKSVVALDATSITLESGFPFGGTSREHFTRRLHESLFRVLYSLFLFVPSGAESRAPGMK